MGIVGGLDQCISTTRSSYADCFEHPARVKRVSRKVKKFKEGKTYPNPLLPVAMIVPGI
jgi:hypothetical protein